MTGTVEPPDRGKYSHLNSSESEVPSTVTSSGMEGSGGGMIEKKNRSFEQIVADEKKNRNILEVKISRKQVEENGELKPAKALTLDDVSVMIFDVIGVKPQDCLGVALYTSRYDTKEIKMKPGVDISCYLTRDSPIELVLAITKRVSQNFLFLLLLFSLLVFQTFIRAALTSIFIYSILMYGTPGYCLVN